MNKWKNFRERVEDYLNVRRNIGYQLKIEGEELLRRTQRAAPQSSAVLLFPRPHYF